MGTRATMPTPLHQQSQHKNQLTSATAKKNQQQQNNLRKQRIVVRTQMKLNYVCVCARKRVRVGLCVCVCVCVVVLDELWTNANCALRWEERSGDWPWFENRAREQRVQILHPYAL